MPSPAPPAAPCRAPRALPPRRPRARAGPAAPPPLLRGRPHNNKPARTAGRGGQGARPESWPGESPACAEQWGPGILRGKRTRALWRRRLAPGVRGLVERGASSAHPDPWMPPAGARTVQPSPSQLSCLAGRSGRPGSLHGAHISRAPAGCQAQKPPSVSPHSAEPRNNHQTISEGDKCDGSSRGPRDGDPGRVVVVWLLRTGHFTGNPKDERWAKLSRKECAQGFRF